MRKVLLFVLSTLAAMLFVPPAYAQCNDAAIRTVMGPVCRQHANLQGYWQTRAAITRVESLVGEFADYGHYAAGAARAAAERGYRDGYGRPVSSGGSSRTKAGIVSGLVAGGVTYAVGRDWRTAVAAAGTSGLMSAAFAGGGRGDREPDCRKPVRKQKDWERQACSEIARQEQEAERQAQDRAMEAERRVERAERDRRGGFHKNLTPFPLRISCGEVDQVLGPGRRVFLPEPSCNGGYRVEVLEPSGDMPGVREDRELGDGRFRSTISEDGRGWVYFYDRPVRRQGGVR